LLALEDGDERIAVVEMGARKYRDIDPLVNAALPDVAVLTNVGEAHLEIMGSPERLADTKWGVFSTGARAVLNLADAVSRGRAATLAAPPTWFGIGDERAADGARAFILGDDDPLAAGLPGEHNRRNLAAALATASALGVEPAAIAAAAPTFALPGGRYERIATPGGPTVIYDAYNASMSGALATLATFGREPASRRIAVIGSMAELGPDAPAMHERVGAAAADAADIVLVGGRFADSLAAGALARGLTARALVRYADNAEAIAWLRAHAASGDVVLLKGSRMYRMEQIVAGLCA